MTTGVPTSLRAHRKPLTSSQCQKYCLLIVMPMVACGFSLTILTFLTDIENRSASLAYASSSECPLGLLVYVAYMQLRGPSFATGPQSPSVLVLVNRKPSVGRVSLIIQTSS
ncbi:hypothetical protein CVT26_002009 [Gymnopilus dilepis]|uniref:Uncharacterized protein n=1 Tax=Gymnopilus dilepis TaxID=231916 RepID=A0A409VC34_9AGAR|nr:hypothetical protein CVT26_002009 [Gymnopilus dilepis]